MRRLYADREEKRVTHGSDISGQDGEQEQLDVNDPNQRSLLAPSVCSRNLFASTPFLRRAQIPCGYEGPRPSGWRQHSGSRTAWAAFKSILEWRRAMEHKTLSAPSDERRPLQASRPYASLARAKQIAQDQVPSA